MNRVRELEMERSALFDELFKLVGMGRTDYENDPELYSLCGKIDDVCGRLSQLGELGYIGGFQYVDKVRDNHKHADNADNEALMRSMYNDNPTGIFNPADYMGKTVIEKDTDNDGDFDERITKEPSKQEE